ncbi:MAG: c-type cytochrome [Ilumatobacteraceae bacterium]|jgi:mono/diheme cytochrome c family protein
MIALASTTIAILIAIAVTLAWLVYAIFNWASGRSEIGSEIELAANRKPYYDDEVLEGKRLERVQFLGVILLATITIGLPVYWLYEPERQANAEEGFTNRFASWGSQLFDVTANGGFNCAGCHGGMNATGGAAEYTVTDSKTGQVKAVSWKAPSLNTVFYRFSEDEVRFILEYGRPFSPMSPWGVRGGGPMNDQQINNLIYYLKSIQIPREDCLVAEADPRNCEGGHLPAETQGEIQAAAERSVEDGTYDSIGEALFNLELGSGAYSCARCHTPGWSWGEPGETGTGAFGWNLTGGATNSHFATEQEMIDFIKAGSVYGAKYGVQGQGSGRMPGFGSTLTDEQIREIVNYVRSEL